MYMTATAREADIIITIIIHIIMRDSATINIAAVPIHIR